MTEQAPYLKEELLRDLDDRLGRLEGHVAGVRRMLERRVPCEDILVQTWAIRAALNQITIRLLEGHVESCLADWSRDKDDRQAIERLERAFAQVLRRS